MVAAANAAESTVEWLSVQCPPFSLFPFMLGWCEDSSALDAFVRRRTIFHTRSSATAFAMGVAFETNLLCSRGRVYDARSLVQTTLDMAEFDNPLTTALASLAAARLQAHLGDASTSRFLLDQAEADFATRRFRLGTTEAASIRVALAAGEGDFTTVLELARPWIETLDQLGMHEPMIIPGILDVIEAAAATQDDALLAQLRRRLQHPPVADRDDVQAARTWLEASALAGAKTNVAQATELLLQLSDHWSQNGRWFWYARVQLSLGRLVRREGARRAAVEYFETALKHFAEMESSQWVDVANAELLRSGKLAKADGRALSTIEAEVARFAAAGRSNKEIAQSMFVSEKTIEAHLSSTYRKLGISRRTQLNAALDQD
jgi:ATP/maltotriose-dependent transcriptional regulator MalT